MSDSTGKPAAVMAYNPKLKFLSREGQNATFGNFDRSKPRTFAIRALHMPRNLFQESFDSWYEDWEGSGIRPHKERGWKALGFRKNDAGERALYQCLRVDNTEGSGLDLSKIATTDGWGVCDVVDIIRIVLMGDTPSGINATSTDVLGYVVAANDAVLQWRQYTIKLCDLDDNYLDNFAGHSLLANHIEQLQASDDDTRLLLAVALLGLNVVCARNQEHANKIRGHWRRFTESSTFRQLSLTPAATSAKIQRTPEQQAVHEAMKKHAERKRQYFGGRKEHLEELSHVPTGPGDLVIVHARAGTGKSALMAQLAVHAKKLNIRVVEFYFSVGEAHTLGSWDQCLNELWLQVQEEGLSESPPRDSVASQLKDWLAEDQNYPTLVIIDGVDEATTRPEHPIYNIPKFGQNVRVVLGVRGSELQARLVSNAARPAVDVKRDLRFVEISDLKPDEAVEWILQWIEKSATYVHPEKLVETAKSIAARAEYNQHAYALHISLMLEDLKSCTKIEDLNTKIALLPTTLRAYVISAYEKISESSESKFLELFLLVGVAYQAIDLKSVDQILNLKLNDPAREIRGELARWLSTSGSGITVTHPAIGLAMGDQPFPDDDPGFSKRFNDMEMRWIDFQFGELEKLKGSKYFTMAEMEVEPPYALRFLPDHLNRWYTGARWAKSRDEQDERRALFECRWKTLLELPEFWAAFIAARGGVEFKRLLDQAERLFHPRGTE